MSTENECREWLDRPNGVGWYWTRLFRASETMGIAWVDGDGKVHSAFGNGEYGAGILREMRFRRVDPDPTLLVNRLTAERDEARAQLAAARTELAHIRAMVLAIGDAS